MPRSRFPAFIAARRANRAAALALTATLAACVIGEPEPRAPAPAIVPLAVGNTWVYLDSVRYTGSGVVPFDSLATDSSLLAITGTRAISFEGRTDTIYLENALRRPAAPASGNFTYIRNEPDGLHTRGARADSLEVTDDVLHVKYPATTGERYPTWFVSLRDEGPGNPPVRVRDSLEIEVVNADTACTVPAGTFRCVHYRGVRAGGVVHADAYYAPGVGFLGSVTTRAETAGGTPVTVRRVRWLAAYSLF